MTVEQDTLAQNLKDYRYGWHDDTPDLARIPKGLSADVITKISALKNEPSWMLKRRLKALGHFDKRAMPTWGADLSSLDFQDIFYYVLAGDRNAKSWDDVPPAVKATFDKLGIPEAEQKFLSGVSGQFDSEVIYHNLRQELVDQGVIFTDTDTALKEYPELFREYFGTVIPANDNKMAALNTAAWSGGSFVYVPEGVEVKIPLQAYFRINSENMGQFERTLIIVEKGARVQYVEGCTAPVFSTNTLHSAVVEIIVKEGAECVYTTLQNWSHNVFNLVTKRAVVQKRGTMRWIDVNLGCLAQGSTLTTREGVIPIEDVTPGQEILAYDDTRGELCFRTVKAKKFSGLQRVREVKQGTRLLRVTDNHPFYSYTYDATRASKLGRYALKYVRADSLVEAIMPCTSIDYGQPFQLEMPKLAPTLMGNNQWGTPFEFTRPRLARLGSDGKTTDELMWLFGLFTGDGSITSQAGVNKGKLRFATVTFSVPTNDRAYTQLRKVMGWLLPGVEPATRKITKVTASWSSIDLAELFINNGFQTGAHSKRIPLWVLNLPESQRLAFVAGYLDSDGTVSDGHRDLSIKSVNRSLLEDVSKILTSLGIASRLHTESSEDREVVIMGHKSTSHGSHRLVFNADSRMLPFICEESREKISGWKPKKDVHFRTVGRSSIELPESVEIRKVKVSEPLEVVPTWDIEVEGVGNFVSEGFIVHNSKITMKYPSVYLVGDGAHGEVLSVAFAGDAQHQDAGAKMVHAAPNTTSLINSKSISKGTGRTSYRGLVKIYPGAKKSKSTVRCDALILDTTARSDTYPYMEIDEEDVTIGHEASVSKVGEEQLFYLRSRGMTEEEATAMIINGFIEPIVKTLPMDYAIEMNRLIQLEMKGSLG